jgi:predicted ATP-dependent serine protease
VADAPWRCSECGTINEPVANACRTCGRWPSLFDLQESLVDEVELENEVLMPQRVEVLEVGEAETFEPEAFEPEAIEVEKQDASEPETPSQRGRRIFGSIIVPFAVAIYLLITFIVNR